MFADGIEQARKQEFTRRIGAREESSHQIPRASAFPFLMRKTWRIDEGTIGFVALQQTFFEEAIESSHYRGVRERPAQLGNDVADAALSVGPENFHQFELEGAEGQGLARAGAAMDAIFQEANHEDRMLSRFAEARRIQRPWREFLNFRRV